MELISVYKILEINAINKTIGLIKESVYIKLLEQGSRII
jgi:hypothetical protein